MHLKGAFSYIRYVKSKTCVKQPLSRRPKIGFQDKLSHNAGQKYCRILQDSAILSTFIKLPFVIKILVLSFLGWPFYTGFTVISCVGQIIPKASFYGTSANSAEPDQILHCLLTECTLKSLMRQLKHNAKQKNSVYDQEIPQSQTADSPIAPRGRATQPSRDTRKTNESKHPANS